MERVDDYKERRGHLASLSETELEQKFWELTDKLTQPMIDLAHKHTSPSIERSVLLRMGFSSLEARSIVDQAINLSLLGKGAGHLVYRYGQLSGKVTREAGLELIEGFGWNRLENFFKKGKTS